MKNKDLVIARLLHERQLVLSLLNNMNYSAAEVKGFDIHEEVFTTNNILKALLGVDKVTSEAVVKASEYKGIFIDKFLN